MKRFIQISLIAILGLTACNNNSGTNTSSNNDTTKETPHSSTSSTEPTASSPVENVLSAYLEIKNALAKDNGQEAANGGNDFINSLNKIDKSALTPDQQKTFTDASDDAKEMAEHIAKNADKIEHQREHFEMLSNDIYDMVKAIKPGRTLYKDFCPMYNNNKGASWISETKDIKNPYLGTKMPTCGEVKEEIK